MAFTPIPRILILGGSISGLSHALVLQTHSPSSRITILERSPTALLHNQGAGVVAGPAVTDFFDAYVRPGRRIAVSSRERLCLDRSGRVVEGSVEVRSQEMTSWDVLYTMLRWRVDGLEAGGYWDVIGEQQPGNDGGGNVEYRYGCNVRGVEDEGDGQGLEVTWTEGEVGEARSEVADLVIAADGRKYVGYVALRGTVPETEISPSAHDVFSEKFAFFHAQGTQNLAYLIPGENGDLRKGRRLVNFVWYVNFEEGSKELDDLMTGKDGKRYSVTLPPGGMRDEIWEREKRRANDVLPPQFAELVTKTKHPFVQAVTDVICDVSIFLDGRLLLVGDALAGFRPHTAASTSQATFDAMTLGEWMQGKIDRTTYRNRVSAYSRSMQELGVRLGERSQFGKHTFA